MSHAIRPVTPQDVPFLWEMLFYAAHMAEDGATSAEAAKTNPRLSMWVKDWGREGDRGLIAYDPATSRKLGAAWLRLWSDPACSSGYVDERTPELAIAVLPECVGQGIGADLIAALIEQAGGSYPAISLTVREGNPARRLYERQGFVEIEQVVNRIGGRSAKMLRRLEIDGSAG